MNRYYGFVIKKQLSIAVVAPVDEPVPPKGYGGTELFVFNLVRGLLQKGHKVTCLASGDSYISGATMVACSQTSTRHAVGANTWTKRQKLWLGGAQKAYEYLLQNHAQYDVIINNNGWQMLQMAQRSPQIIGRLVTVLHGTLYNKREAARYNLYSGPMFRYVSISHSQRRPMPHLNYVATIYHGIDVSQFAYQPYPKNYLAWLGRYTPDKGPLQAIQIAKKLGVTLHMAGKVDQADEKYFTQKVASFSGSPNLTIGSEVAHAQKVQLLKNANALLMPLQWHEPFGLVMIESLACGTPVVVNAMGSAPEIIQDGKTGLLCKNEKEAIARIKAGELAAIDRLHCRKTAHEQFHYMGMVARYEQLCYSLSNITGSAVK